MENSVAIEIKNVSKYFGEVVANKNINLSLKKGEILSLLGENGSGKTTLMNMLSGIYFPDEGQIFVDGKEVVIKSPKDAFDNKIGMVHQHFKLVNVFTAADNIILGEDVNCTIKDEYNKLKNSDKKDFKYYLKLAALPFTTLFKRTWLSKNRVKMLQEIVDKYGFDIDLSKKIYDMSVSEKQTVEIIKVLYRGAEILILDEPTAVLTPQETQKLFDVLRNMKQHGKSIIIITHKLNEVLEISDEVAILRKGEYIGTVNTKEATELSLTEMMVGQKVELNIDRPTPKNVQERLVVKDLCCKNREGVEVLKSVSFEAKSGEILGIAGIAGSGQRELLEAIAGLQKLNGGTITYLDPNNENKEINLMTLNPTQIRELGVRLSFVPEDRLGMGLVGNMDIIDNVMLRSYRKGHSFFLDRKAPKKLADDIVHDLEVVTPSTHTPVRRLSGGNVQKVLVGREIASAPTVLMAAYPVRGLDINSSYTIYKLLNDQKENGAAVIFVGEDLDVLIALCDRIMVVCHGEITGIVDGKDAKKEQIGLMMTNTTKKEDK